MDTMNYLARIGCDDAAGVSAQTLRRLHRAHLLHVPFENLDVRMGEPIALQRQALYRKIVERGRGGFCYELNSLFAGLLEALGFDVTLLSARVFKDEDPGPEFDHLMLRVELDRPWLVDVGFGTSFMEPLPLDEPCVQSHGDEQFRLDRRADGTRVLRRRGEGAGWRPQYIFSLTPRRLEEFAGMCEHHQRSAESSFTRTVVCMRATVSGRVTLNGGELIEADGVARRSSRVCGVAALDGALRGHFGIRLSHRQLERLAGMLGQ